MKNLFLILFIFSATILTGCNREHIDDGVHDIVVFFTTEGIALKSTATPEEKDIMEVILFGVDGDGNFIQHYLVTQSQLSAPEDIVLTKVSRKVKTFYAIANPSVDMKEAVTNSELNATYLNSMTNNFSTHPSSPFLMSGTENIKNYSVHIDFVRTVARVEITALNELEIITVTVENTPNTGYVFTQSPFSIPSSTRVAYENINPISPSHARIYIAENIAANPAKITLSGEFEGLPVSYSFFLKQNDKDIDIVRNRNYKVEITPALEGTGGFTINIPDWTDVDMGEIEIPDEELNQQP